MGAGADFFMQNTRPLILYANPIFGCNSYRNSENMIFPSAFTSRPPSISEEKGEY